MNGRLKHSLETRIEAAKLFDAGFGRLVTSRELGISEYTARGWFDSHRQGRLVVLNTMSVHKSYSWETKVAAVEKFLAGIPVPEVIDFYGIANRGLFNKWVALYRKAGPEGLKPKPKGRPKSVNIPLDQETLEQKVARLEFENEALKKLNALVALEQRRISKR